jgi:hypothetical protein
MLTWLKGVFSSDSCNSFSRSATALTVVTGAWSLVYLVLKNHDLPDPMKIAALAGWMTSPYAVNQARVAFGRSPQQPG